MHLEMLAAALLFACGARWYLTRDRAVGLTRWQRAILGLVLPPALVLSTAISLAWMGPRGQMAGIWQGWLCFGLAMSFVAYAAFWLLRLGWQAWRSRQQIRTLPERAVRGYHSRIVASAVPFAAQVGVWSPELVLSQGLLDELEEERLEAVLVHEQAHVHYRDTFWFFWLGWLQHLGAWLPHTRALWQELLTLRELRADARAAKTVDRLVLAEALFQVASTPIAFQPRVAFGAEAVERLEERVDALLSDSASEAQWPSLHWSWLLTIALPLLAIPFHV
ncbi:MAG: M56 family metallopeptidase [Cyanobacteria bacterium P01_E01_bin.48]